MDEFNIETVVADERITRYINEKSKIKPSTGTVRHNAFMPPPGRSMSVYRTTGLLAAEVWEISDKFVQGKGKPIIALADLVASEILKNHLVIEIVPTPHPRHADITGWPEEESKQLSIAIDLARCATLTMRG